jgi:hypothetical protein
MSSEPTRHARVSLWSFHWALVCLAMTLVVTVAPSALAEPYTIFARYVSPDASATTLATIAVDGNDTLFPANPVAASFDGLFIKTKTDELSKLEISRLERIDVTVKFARSSQKEYSITAAELSNGIAKQIASPSEVQGDGPATTVTIEVRPKFTDVYLCHVEDEIRAASGKPVIVAPIPAKAGPKKLVEVSGVAPSNWAALQHDDKVAGDTDRNIDAYAILFSRGLTDSAGVPVVFTFCKAQHDQIDWYAVASIGQATRVTTETARDKAHADHKKVIADKVIGALRTSGGVPSAHPEKRGADERDNVYALTTHTVTALLSVSDLTLEEFGTHPPNTLPAVVDKRSQIVLRVAGSTFCSHIPNCNTVIAHDLGVSVASTDKDGKTTSVEGNLTATGGGWIVLPDLSKYLGQTVSFTIYFKAGESAKIALLGNQYSAQVENLGIVTSFPVVSDVVAAATKNPANPSDVTTQSSIPVSWAISLSHADPAQAAVTFPWMIGWNTRYAPRLNDIVKLFPHVSVIFPLKTDTTIRVPRVGFGFGIALVNAFTFSLAVTVQGTPQSFFMVGLSAPDLGKMANAM